MALNDFRAVQDPMGGHLRIAWGRISAATLRRGEPVLLDGGGDVTAAADDALVYAGIALAPMGVTRGFENPDTGAIYVAGGRVPYIAFTNDTIFATDNFATDGAGTAAVPARTTIGDLCGFTLAAGVYSVDAGATNKCAIVVDVLDADGKSLNLASAAAGHTVYFKVGSFSAGVIIQWQGGM